MTRSTARPIPDPPAAADPHRPGPHRVARADAPDAGTGTAGWTRADADAFVAREYAGLHAWLWSRTGSSEVAADLTQASFTAFWASCARRPVREPRPWLYRIARHQWGRACRDRAVAERHLPALARAADVAGAATGGADSDEARERVRHEVARLPEGFRDVLVLRYWSSLTHREVGRVLGIPATLARWRAHRAIRLLEDRLGEATSFPGPERGVTAR